MRKTITLKNRDLKEAKRLAIHEEISLTRLVEYAILFELHNVYDNIAPERLERRKSRSPLSTEEYEKLLEQHKNMEPSLFGRGEIQAERVWRVINREDTS